MARRSDSDEYEFDDDAFDQLPANALQQLEREAFLNTQRPKDGLQERIAVNDASRLGQEVEFDYEYDEDDVIDLNAEPISLPPPQNNLQTGRHAQYQQAQRAPYGRQAFSNGETAKASAAATIQLNGNQASTQDADVQLAAQVINQTDPDLTSLLAQVEELRKRNEELQQISKQSQINAQTKAGEAALLRRRIDTTSNDYEQRLQRMQEAHTQAFNNQKAQLDVAMREKRQVEDNNRFLEHDLRQANAATAAKQNKPVTKDTVNGRSKSFDKVGTPRKTDRKLPFRDGFEDDEDVMIVSPSKNRLKQLTPRKGEKRKRSADQSPASTEQLPFGEPAGSPAVSLARQESEQTPLATADEGLPLIEENKRLDLMQILLSHRPLPSSDDRFMELLATFAFPSQPSTKLSSIVITQIRSLPTSSYAFEMIQALLSMWQRCLQESYYQPVNAFVETVTFLLRLQPLSLASRLHSIILPLIMKTVDLVAIPTGLAGKSGNALPAEAAMIEEQIDIQLCLELLQHIALGCTRDRAPSSAQRSFSASESEGPDLESDAEPAIQSFWRIMQFDFVLLLLMRWQPVPAMRSILAVLRTSCLPGTFGTISTSDMGITDQDRQSKREDDIIHRLLDLLFETPKPLKDGRNGCNELDLALIRLDVLNVFTAMCIIQPATQSSESHGSRLLVHHSRVIGKMFRFLCDSTNRLYNYPPPPLHHFPIQVSPQQSPHTLTADAVNATVRILHHLITRFEKEIDIRQKLAAVPGGHHKYLLSLSRLAFSDQLVLDAGIEDATVDAAHDLLDNYLTYEEGESLLQLFSTPTSRSAAQSGTVEAGRVGKSAAEEGESMQMDIPNPDEEMEAARNDDEEF